MEVCVKWLPYLLLFIDRSSCSSLFAVPFITAKERFVLCSSLLIHVCVFIFSNWLYCFIHAHHVFVIMSPPCDALDFLSFLQKLPYKVYFCLLLNTALQSIRCINIWVINLYAAFVCNAICYDYVLYISIIYRNLKGLDFKMFNTKNSD